MVLQLCLLRCHGKAVRYALTYFKCRLVTSQVLCVILRNMMWTMNLTLAMTMICWWYVIVYYGNGKYNIVIHLVLHCTDEAQLGRNSCLYAVACPYQGPWKWKFVLWNNNIIRQEHAYQHCIAVWWSVLVIVVWSRFYILLTTCKLYCLKRKTLHWEWFVLWVTMNS